MTFAQLALAAAAALALAVAAAAQEAPPTSEIVVTTPAVASAWEVTLAYEDSSRREDGSSESSSRGQTAVTERVLERDARGWLIEYGFPPDTSEEDRLREWQFPLRVFRSNSGDLVLANEAELQARADEWLERAKLSREACGTWYFTWNAFRVDCDPATALGIAEGYDLWLMDFVRTGKLGHEFATEPRAAVPTRDDAGNTIYTAALTIDPEKVRKSELKSQEIAATFYQDDAYLAEQVAKINASEYAGSVLVIVTQGSDGIFHSVKTVSTLTVTLPEGERELRNSQRTLTRTPLMGQGE